MERGGWSRSCPCAGAMEELVGREGRTFRPRGGGVEEALVGALLAWAGSREQVALALEQGTREVGRGLRRLEEQGMTREEAEEHARTVYWLHRCGAEFLTLGGVEGGQELVRGMAGLCQRCHASLLTFWTKPEGGGQGRAGGEPALLSCDKKS